MQTITCFNQTCTHGNCQNCPERALLHTTLDIEQANAEKALDRLPGWLFGMFLVVVALGLIIGNLI
jgi:hypothetical protein